MKLRLMFKFWLVYAAIAVAAFILISTLGAYLSEYYLQETYGRNLYQETRAIIEDFSADGAAFASRDAYESLCSLASYNNASILILNQKGVIFLDTDGDFPAQQTALENFDPTFTGNNYYTVGTFFDYYDEDRLCVMLPIPGNLSISGYVAMTMPYSEVIAERENILGIIHLISIIIFILTFVIMLMILLWVSKPLKKITKGANNFASGNLDYEIDVHTGDELGDLARSLNMMASDLKRVSDDQHKFIANVSHDFRSPLTSIKGYLEAILDGTIPYEKQDKYLHIVVKETERLNKLTRELLDLDTIDLSNKKMKMETYDINQSIRETVNTFEGICQKKNIRLHLVLEGESLYVIADKGRIQQVLYNLIDNAIKFSNAGSEIVIETSERHAKAHISIKDHGVGIPKSSLTNIWKRFYKIDASRGKDRTGTGLGLSIVREIITAHDQKITVISTENVGTEFIFTLASANIESE